MSSVAARLALAGLALAGGARQAAAQNGGDSTLAAACAGGEAIADGLLLVEFRADVPAERRAAMAAEAGGGLVPAPDGGPAAYVTIPGGSRAAADAAADRLIRLDGVQAVGGVSCPPAPPPAAVDSVPADSAARADTSARPDTSSGPDTSARPGTAADSGVPADSTASPTATP